MPKQKHNSKKDCQHRNQQIFSQKDIKEVIVMCDDCQERMSNLVNHFSDTSKFPKWEESSYYINSLR